MTEPGVIIAARMSAARRAVVEHFKAARARPTIVISLTKRFEPV